MADAHAEATNWIAEYAERALRPAELRRLVRMTDDEIVAHVPDYQADEELRRDLHASTGAHWRGFLAAVTRDPFEVHPPPEALDLVRTIVRRELDVTVLLKTYRVAQRAVWQHVAGKVVDEIADGDVRSGVLVRFWDRVGRWIDGSVEVLVGTHTEEREQRWRGALARRAETVRLILRGEETDVDAATASLGYPLRRNHTAFVLWLRDGVAQPDGLRVLSSAAMAIAGALDSPHPLTVVSGARGLWGWAATPTPADPVGDVDLPAGVRAAVGISAAGLPGFGRSHREAIAAQSVAIVGALDADVTRYADVELPCLAAGLVGTDGMRALIERELGALAAPDDTTARLRRTVRLYLANGASADLAGKALLVHRNTVRYRVRQAERLIGHSVHERRAHLELALACLAAFGDPATPDPGR